MSEQNAYFAGLIDGEGCLFLEKRSGSRAGQVRPTIEVGMTCKLTIEALRAAFGGNITFKAAKGTRKDQWRWRVQDRRAREVLAYIYPHMITKREDADLLLAHWKRRGF